MTHGYTTAREHLSHWFNSDYVSFRSRIQNKKYANLLTCISEEYWIAMRNDWKFFMIRLDAIVKEKVHKKNELYMANCSKHIHISLLKPIIEFDLEKFLQISKDEHYRFV